MTGPIRLAAPRVVCFLVVALAVFGGGCNAGEKVEQRNAASAEQTWQLCSRCHGEQGEGNPVINTPAIAGLGREYVERQLHKFRDGLRGNHFDDTTGMQMRPMARSLTEVDVTTIAAYVSSLPRQPAPVTLEGGDPGRGASLFAPCAACHGQKAEGNEQLKAPQLAGANDWYLYRQIEHFKAGVRGAKADDLEGAQMRPMAQTLTTDQAMKDVLAYIGTLR